MMDDRELSDDSGNRARINLASAGRYAVALNGRIYQAETVQALRDKVAHLGWK
jgi:hypothetical protein